MREIIPPEISELLDKMDSYMIPDSNSLCNFRLKENAPPDVIEAREKYIALQKARTHNDYFFEE